MKDLLFVYPNKFKIIKNMDEVIDDCSIYYVNENIPGDLIEPLTRWISDVLEKREYPPAGFKNASISYSDFCTKYGYDFTKMNYGWVMSMDKCEYYYSREINPIRFLDGNKIVLWGQLVYKSYQLHNYQPSINSLTDISVIMSFCAFCLGRSISESLKYLSLLKYNRLVYGVERYCDDIVLIKLTPLNVWNINVGDKDELKKCFFDLVSHYTNVPTLLPKCTLCFDKKEKTFHKELKTLINRYSKENGSDTPDFMLADYLLGCLSVYDETVNKREKWYGRGIVNPIDGSNKETGILQL